MDFGIAFFLRQRSWNIAESLMLILWNKLVEKELLEYWGEEYEEFMKT